MKIYSKIEAKSEILRLVDAFGQRIRFYKSDQYKEASLEDEYLKPFLSCLNWNVSNEGINNVANREVIVQAKGKKGKGPDYLLQLDGKPFFYIEAKHPKFKLWKETEYIWQAYSYVYSTQSSAGRLKVDFSLLTDFEEFRFFDCTFKADKKTVTNFAVLDWKFTEYETRFEELWDLFEKDNIRKGSLHSLYLNEKKIKQNRIPPDKAFLDDLDNEKTGWRIQLAKDIKKNNPEISASFITRVVQLIIDRIIFVKVLSDREIEDDFLAEILHTIDKASLKSDEGILNESCSDIFNRLNRTYNGSIFASKTELDQVVLSNKTLKSILSDLLPENSRYNFKQIPVEVLGTIYEHFLGKVIETTEKRATVEYKPEVRKAGGVYYTPQYIVEYIVENTVGVKLKACRTIDMAMEIKICDPACGSGSFLLGAYNHLLNWCIQYYEKKITNDKAITKKEQEHIYLDASGNIRLTSKLRRDILKNCIFGVDIDPQAVEVAITSLSLKALEGRRHDELYAEVDLFHETVLPDLSKNIRCGNSLIGEDSFDGKLNFDQNGFSKINPFSWEKEFESIFRNDGFDCIIGNPPYVRQETLGDIFKKYASTHYQTIAGTADLYIYFIEKGVSLLKDNGIFGYIVANKWMRANYGEPLRRWFKKQNIEQIIDFGDLPVFSGAITYPCILIIKKSLEASDSFYVLNADSLSFDTLSNYFDDNRFITNKIFLNDSGWTLTEEKSQFLMQKIKSSGIPLIEFVEKKIYRGILTGLNDAFVIDSVTRAKLISEDPNCAEIIKPFLGGRDIKRYETPKADKFIIYFTKGFTNLKSGKEKNKWKWLSKNYPSLANHLQPFEKAGLKRYDKGDYWWELRACDYNEEFEKPKIIIPAIIKSPEFIFDTSSFYSNDKTTIVVADDLVLFAILNSNVSGFFISQISSTKQGGFFEYKPMYISQIPIPDFNGNTDLEIERNERIKRLVESLISLNKQFKNNSFTDQQKSIIEKKINHIDEEIDILVYQIYNLNDEEIKIIEDSLSNGK